jgi:hypothetical protein
MRCPVCKEKKSVEIDMHCDGFAEALEECGHCGSVWTMHGAETSVLHGPVTGMPQVSADM